MLGFMPSEIARLVLGYLQETGCEQAKTQFLTECRHLQEYAQCLEAGLKYPTTIEGRGLQTMLQDYYTLTHLDLENSLQNQLLLSSLEGSVNQVKRLLGLLKSNKSSPRKVARVPRPALKALHNGKSASPFTRLKQRRCLLKQKKVEMKSKDTPSVSAQLENEQEARGSMCIDTNLYTPPPLSTYANNGNSTVSNCQESDASKRPLRSVKRSCGNSSNTPLKKTCSLPSTSDYATSPLTTVPSDNLTKNGASLIQLKANLVSEQYNSASGCSTPDTANLSKEMNRTCSSQTTYDRSTSPYSPYVSHSTPGIPDNRLCTKRFETSLPPPHSRSLENRCNVQSKPPQQQSVPDSAFGNPRTVMPVKCDSKPMYSQSSINTLPSRSSAQQATRSTVFDDPNVEDCRLNFEPGDENYSEPYRSPAALSECNSPLNLAYQKTLANSPVVGNREVKRVIEIPVIDLIDSSQGSALAKTPRKHFLGFRSQAAPTPRKRPESCNDSVEKHLSNSAASQSECMLGENTFDSSAVLQAEEAWRLISIEKKRLENTEQRNTPSSSLESDKRSLRRSPRISGKRIGSDCGSSPFRKTPVASPATSNRSVCLQSPPLITPLNSVEPELPDRFPDPTSPRYVLSQQRAAEFMVPSLTTPVKQYHQAIINQQGFSPKRKSQIPRRRLLSSPSVRPQLATENSSISPFKLGTDEFMDFERMFQLINYPPLIEKLVANINKVKGVENCTDVFLEENEEPSLTPSTSEFPAVSETFIREVLDQTELDPVFEDTVQKICEKRGNLREAKATVCNDLKESLNNTIPMENNLLSGSLRNPDHMIVSSQTLSSLPSENLQPIAVLPSKASNCSVSGTLNDVAISVPIVPVPTFNSTVTTKPLPSLTIAVVTSSSLARVSTATPTRNTIVSATLATATTTQNKIASATLTNATSMPSSIDSSTVATTKSTVRRIAPVPVPFPKPGVDSITASTSRQLVPTVHLKNLKYPSPKKDLLQRTLECFDMEVSPAKTNPVEGLNAPPALKTLPSMNSAELGTCVQVLNRSIMSTTQPNTYVLSGTTLAPVNLMIQNGVNVLTLSPGKFYTQALSDIFIDPGQSSGNNQLVILPQSDNRKSKKPVKKVQVSGKGQVSRSRLEKILPKIDTCQSSVVPSTNSSHLSTFIQKKGTNSFVRVLNFGHPELENGDMSLQSSSKSQTEESDAKLQPGTSNSNQRNSKPDSTVANVNSSPSTVVYLNALGQPDHVSTIDLSRLNLLRDSSSASASNSPIAVAKTSAAKRISNKQKVSVSPSRKKSKTSAVSSSKKEAKRSTVSASKKKVKISVVSPSKKKAKTSSAKRKSDAKAKTEIGSPKMSVKTIALELKRDYSKKNKDEAGSSKVLNDNVAPVCSEPSSQELLKAMDIGKFLSSVHKELDLPAY